MRKAADLAMADATFSPDGRWLWTGSQWVPAPPTAPPIQPSSISGDDYFAGDGCALERLPREPAETSWQARAAAQASATDSRSPTQVTTPGPQGRMDRGRAHHSSALAGAASMTSSPGSGLLRRLIGRCDSQIESAFGWKRLGPWRWVLAGSVIVGAWAALTSSRDIARVATDEYRLAVSVTAFLFYVLLGALVWVPGALYHRARQPEPRPPWRLAVGVTLAVMLLAMIGILNFVDHRQKALDASARAGELREMPTCEPVGDVTFTSDKGTCGISPMSEAYRRLVIERCGMSDWHLTSEWWRPDPKTIAYFHTISDTDDARIQPATGEVDCG